MRAIHTKSLVHNWWFALLCYGLVTFDTCSGGLIRGSDLPIFLRVTVCILHGTHHSSIFNTLGPRQNGRHFPDDTFKRIFLNENVRISIKISLKFAPKGPINNIPALVQIMAWRRPGDKPLSEPMMGNLPTHICVTRPQGVKSHEIWLVVIGCLSQDIFQWEDGSFYLSW